MQKQQDSFEDSDDKLSDILAAYGIKTNKNDESVEEIVNKPIVKDCENHCAPRVWQNSKVIFKTLGTFCSFLICMWSFMSKSKYECCNKACPGKDPL